MSFPILTTGRSLKKVLITLKIPTCSSSGLLLLQLGVPDGLLLGLDLPDLGFLLGEPVLVECSVEDARGEE